MKNSTIVLRIFFASIGYNFSINLHVFLILNGLQLNIGCGYGCVPKNGLQLSTPLNIQYHDGTPVTFVCAV